MARAVVIAAIAMAAILAGTAWLGYRSAQEASRLVARGQAEALLDQIRQRLHELGGPPSRAQLGAITDELAPRGVTDLQFLEAGDGPPFTMTDLGGGRLVVVARLPPRPGPPRRPPPAIQMTFRSSAAEK